MHKLIALVLTTMVLTVGALGAVAAQEATPTATAEATATDPSRTTVRYVLPYGADGLNAGLSVVGNESGRCDAESAADPGRPDAWRCVSGGPLDPCFENPFADPAEPGPLACLASPFSSEVVLFTPSGPLPRQKDDAGSPPTGRTKGDAAAVAPAAIDAAGSEPLPWALELANGERCTLASGATAALAGMRLNYFCGGGSVLGEPDRGLPVWTVAYLPDGAFATAETAVSTAWF